MSLGGGGVEMSRHEVTEIVSKRNHQISSSGDFSEGRNDQTHT